MAVDFFYSKPEILVLVPSAATNLFFYFTIQCSQFLFDFKFLYSLTMITPRNRENFDSYSSCKKGVPYWDKSSSFVYRLRVFGTKNNKSYLLSLKTQYRVPESTYLVFIFLRTFEKSSKISTNILCNHVCIYSHLSLNGCSTVTLIKIIIYL